MYKNFSFCFTFERFFPIILIILCVCEKEREKEKKRNLMFLLLHFFIAFNKSTSLYKSL